MAWKLLKSFSSLPREQDKPRVSEVIILLAILLCLGALSFSWSAPASGISGAEPVTSTPNSPAPPAPSIKLSPIFPDELGFSEIFDLNVAVTNYGHATAQNLHVLLKANPGGFFQVHNVDQPSSPIDANTEDVSLGNIDPGGQVIVNFRLEAPSKTQVGAYGTEHIQIDFTTRYYGSPALPAGTVTFKTQHSRLLLSQQGFVQQ